MKFAVFIYILLLLLAVFAPCYGQIMQVFDVDAGGFPNIRAKLLALDSSFRSAQPSNTTIYENNIQRTVTSAYCPPATPFAALSSVLVLDVSGSVSAGYPQKNIELLRSAARFWIGLQDYSKSECAVNIFDANSYIVRDFTRNKNTLLQNVDAVEPQSGTNHRNALLSSPDGGIPTAARGKFKRLIIFITDGQSNIVADEAIAAAKDIDAAVYGVGLRVALTDSIKKVISRTGGIYFENINSEHEIPKICKAIYAVASGQNICRIEWLSSSECDIVTQVEMQDKILGAACKFSYVSPISRRTYLTVTPSSINFGKVSPWSQVDTAFELRADNGDIFIKRIVFDNPFFTTYDNPVPFVLKSGATIRLHVRFSPADELFALGNLKIESDACSQGDASAIGGNTDGYDDGYIRIIRPNGREKLFAGTDTVIQWTGTPPGAAAVIEFSSDGGSNWEKITDSAVNYRFVWKIPKTASDSCLLRIATATKLPADTSFDLPMDVWNIRYSRSGNLLVAAGYTSAGNGRIEIYSAKQKERSIVGVPIDLPNEKISDADISPDENYAAAFSRNTATLFTAKIADGTVEKYVLPEQVSGYAGISFTPDGKYIAVGRYVFDVSAKQFTVTFENAENTGALSPDGKIMAVSLTAGERRLSLRHFDNRAEICRMPQHSLAASAPVYIAAWSADATTVASATANNNDIIVADTLCGLKSRIPAQTHPISNIALNYSAEILAAAYYGDTIKLWNVKSGKLIRNIKKRIINGAGVNVDFTALAFSPDGRELAAGGNGHLIFIRLDSASNSNYWRPIAGFNHKNNNQRGIETSISPDGKQTLVLYERERPDLPISSKNMRTAEIWNVETPAVKFTIPNVYTAVYGRSGKYVLAVTDSVNRSFTTIYNARTGQKNGRAIDISGGKITAIDISPDDSLAVIARGDSVLLMRLGENPAVISVAPYKFNAPLCLVFTDNGTAVWLAENNGTRGKIYILRHNNSEWDIKLQSVYQKQLASGDAGCDAMQYAVVMNDFSPIIEKMGNGAGFNAKNNVTNVKYSSDGHYLIFPYNGVFDTVINGKSIKSAGARIYSRQGELIQMLADTSFEYPIFSGSFSNYGRRIATLGYSSANNDNKTVVWEGKPQNSARSDTLFSIVMPKPDFRDANFGETPAGTSKDTIFDATILNGGDYPLYISSVSFDSPIDAEFTLVAGLPAEIPPFGNIPVELRFSPLKEGNYSATAKFSTNIGEVQINLLGTAAITAPVMPEAIDFGGIAIGSIKDSTVKSIIRNASGQDIIISQITLRGPDSLHFKLIFDGKRFTLKSGQSHELALGFAPEFVARTSARLEFTYASSSDFNKIYSAVIPLYGEGLCDANPSAININISDKIIFGKTGENIEIIIKTPQTLDVSALRIKYNRSVLLPLDSNAIIYGTGNIGYTIIPVYNKYGNDTLAIAKFRIALGDTDSATVTVDSVIFEGCKQFVLSDSATVLITDICRAGGQRLFDGSAGRAALAMLPNPIFGGTPDIAIRLIEKGNSKLELYDGFGRSLLTIFEGEQQTGERQIKVNFDEISSGNYTLVLRTPNQIITLPIIIAR